MSVSTPQSIPIPDDESEKDRADMARLAAGYEAALNELMERHGERLFHYLIRCLKNEDEAADLSQETFVRVYQHRQKFDPRQKFTTWLYAIASNLVRDYFRRHGRHPHISLDAASDPASSPCETIAEQKPSPSEEIQAQERADSVRQAISELPEELRIPLILAEYEELSQAEIGEILGCSVKAVETRIYRARQILRVKLSKLLV
jgi:RNA polymerase sigma-70 factor (ECF subfamily)